MSMNYYDENDEDDDLIDDQDNGQNDQNGGGDSSIVRQQAEKAVNKQTQKVASKGAQEGVKAGAQAGAKLGAKAGAQAAGSSSLMAAIAPVLGYVILAIVLIVVVVGMIMFLITMPGMAMQKLKDMFHRLGAGVAAFFGADTTKQIDNAELFGILDYLETMGYDLKGYGFLSDFCEPGESFESPKADVENYGNDYYYDEENGVFRYNVDDTIAYAKTDFIFQYIMSDNYVYTLKNDNIVTQTSENWFLSIIHGAKAFLKHLSDAIGIPSAWGDEWGKGLIAVYQEAGGQLGVKDTSLYNQSLWKTIFSKDKIEIDVDRKKLILENNSFLNRNNPIEYNLDGWTGRYGMPLEFLLSVHMATMMPDLAYDMTIAFPTEVNILLRELKGWVEAGYQTKDKGLIEQKKIEENMQPDSPIWTNRQEWYKLLSGYEKLSEKSLRAVTAILMGVEHSPDCVCRIPEGWTPDTPGTMIVDVNGYECIPVDPTLSTKEINDIAEKIKNTTNEEEKLKLLNENFKRKNQDTADFDGIFMGTTNVQIVENVLGYFPIDKGCIDYINDINDAMNEAKDGDYDAYLPYISEVKNHWFRDVYFVKPVGETLSFVKTDADFEKIMKDRWSVYEVWEEADKSNGDPKVAEFAKKHQGEYKLYYIPGDDDVDVTKEEDLNLELWTDTLEEAEKQGIKLTKKAVTFEDDADLEDMGWLKTGDVWSAYKNEEGTTASGFKPAYSQADLAGFSEEERQIKQNVMANVITKGNISQVGEGLRTETNSRIKKMFMKADYFVYDGEAKKAEEILEYRKKISPNHGKDEENLYFGVLTKEDKSIIDAEEGKKEINESLIYRKVDLKDSLNAFSMLENTHTLDADYIYRDFKELVIELGYFDKKDFSDTTPRLMAWFIPDQGSFGWPKKELDNRENYYGAMAHSEEDYKANEKNTMKAIVAQLNEEVSPNAVNPANYPQPDAKLKNIGASMTTVGGSSKAAKSPQQVSVKEFLDTTRAMCEYMDEVGYDYCVLRGDKKEGSLENDENGQHIVYCDHQVHHNGCTLSNSFEESKQSTSVHNVCCSTLGSWAIQNVGVMPDSEHTNGVGPLSAWITNNLDAERIEPGEQLKEGDYLFYRSNGHVDICGRKKGGGFEKYNGGHYCNSSRSSIGTVENTWEYALRIPWGQTRKPGIWKGYEGNEAVVSPVTGILLEYGVYEKAVAEEPVVKKPETNKPTPDTAEPVEEIEDLNKNRLNVDLYEGPVNPLEEERNENNPGVSIEGGVDESPIEYEPTYEIYDQVGYAKILTLTPEIYRIIEQSTSNRWSNGYSSAAEIIKMTEEGTDNSLVRVRQSTEDTPKGETIYKGYFTNPLLNTDQMGEKEENWSDIDKTIYGYKEFAELYDKFGLSKYEVYIDGFVCETPDAELAARAEEDKEMKMYEQLPSGKPITIDTFKVPESQVGEDTGDESALISMYYPDVERKLISQKETEKMEAELATQSEASPALTVENPFAKLGGASNLKHMKDLIVIKEGTVLGRTMTDKEVITKIRKDDTPEPYEYYRKPEEESKNEKGEEENLNKVMGNYVRITMKNEKGEKVEHVEDYFKLDEYKRDGNDWELFYWLPFESYGTDKPGGGPECQGTCSEGETAVGIIQWTVLVESNMNNIANQFIPGCLEENASLCAPLSNYEKWGPEQFWEDYKGAKQFQACLKQICEADRDEFLRVQMEVAKKQYLEPLIEKYGWLESRPKCVQGEIMHLAVWGADTSWVGGAEGMSDQEIILKVRNVIANTGSTAGAATGDEGRGRAYNEPQIALEILEGNLAPDEVEEWVRTGDSKVLPFDFK